MTWHYTSGRYTLNAGEVQLKVWLDPAVNIPSEDDELGSEEHPFVWLFEVREGNRCDVRGVRETLAEAQRAALTKLEQVQPAAFPWAEGF